MNKVELSIIKSESKRIREILENYAINSRFTDYGVHLNGACAVASVELKNILKKHKIKSQTYVGTFGRFYQDSKLYKKKRDENTSDFKPMLATHQHCWLETENHLVDITITQFKNKFSFKTPRILILDKKSKKYRKYLNYWIEYKKNNNFSDWEGSENPKHWNKIIKKMKIKNSGILISF